MKIVKEVRLMQRLAKSIKREGKTIGFIPTMGYLHEGHLSLVREARKDTDVTVMSIYVNPMQFGPKEDYKRYPRNLKRDMRLAKSSGTDIIFVPLDKEMYPEGYSSLINVKDLNERLCGKSRPGHFTGVSTVVAKLFNIVMPSVAYFGQKDVQQAAVIKKMVQDLNMDTRIKVMPIVREPDGLAMSSRNVYLNKAERKDALSLYKALELAKGMINSGKRNAEEIISEMKKYIENTGSLRIDYIKIVDAEALKPVYKIKGRVLVALAIRIGNTRLIDNIVVNVKKPVTSNQ
jgi:pantoate--beta-alanine ligase